jgi:hypothetical protein
MRENLVLVLKAPLPYQQVQPEQRFERAVAALARAVASDEALRQRGYVRVRKQRRSLHRIAMMHRLVQTMQEEMDRSGEPDLFD